MSQPRKPPGRKDGGQFTFKAQATPLQISERSLLPPANHSRNDTGSLVSGPWLPYENPLAAKLLILDKDIVEDELLTLLGESWQSRNYSDICSTERQLFSFLSDLGALPLVYDNSPSQVWSRFLKTGNAFAGYLYPDRDTIMTLPIDYVLAQPGTEHRLLEDIDIMRDKSLSSPKVLTEYKTYPSPTFISPTQMLTLVSQAQTSFSLRCAKMIYRTRLFDYAHDMYRMMSLHKTPKSRISSRLAVLNKHKARLVGQGTDRSSSFLAEIQFGLSGDLLAMSFEEASKKTASYGGALYRQGDRRLRDNAIPIETLGHQETPSSPDGFENTSEPTLTESDFLEMLTVLEKHELPMT